MGKRVTVAMNELLCLKNAGAQISTIFTSYKYSAPMAIKKNQNPGGHFGAKQQCQSSPFTSKMNQMG